MVVPAVSIAAAIVLAVAVAVVVVVTATVSMSGVGGAGIGGAGVGGADSAGLQQAGVVRRWRLCVPCSAATHGVGPRSAGRVLEKLLVRTYCETFGCFFD